jgi:hypothetical protein
MVYVNEPPPDRSVHHFEVNPACCARDPVMRYAILSSPRVPLIASQSEFIGATFLISSSRFITNLWQIACWLLSTIHDDVNVAWNIFNSIGYANVLSNAKIRARMECTHRFKNDESLRVEKCARKIPELVIPIAGLSIEDVLYCDAPFGGQVFSIEACHSVTPKVRFFIDYVQPHRRDVLRRLREYELRVAPPRYPSWTSKLVGFQEHLAI